MSTLPTDGERREREERTKRFQQVLDKLTASGMTQAEIAQRLAVPPPYVSDVKNGYRTLTDLFARRVGEEFGIDFLWLLHGVGDGRKPTVAVAPRSTGKLLLPILKEPCLGDPAVSAMAEGNLQEVSGAAAVAAANADKPYLLRLGHDAPAVHLRAGDLLLMTQGKEHPENSIVVLRMTDHGAPGTERLLLCRRRGEDQFQSLTSNATVRGEAQVVGACMGLVWRGM